MKVNHDEPTSDFICYAWHFSSLPFNLRIAVVYDKIIVDGIFRQSLF